jgi:hypothetical protein
MEETTMADVYSIDSHIAAAKSKIAAAIKKRNLLASDQAKEQAKTQAVLVLNELERAAKLMDSDEIPMSLHRDEDRVIVAGAGSTLEFQWAYADILRNDRLLVTLLDKGVPVSDKSIKVNPHEFSFDVLESEKYGWGSTQGDRTFYTSNALVRHYFRLFLEKVTESIIMKLE